MTIVKRPADAHAKLENLQPIDLTVTLEGTGTASAYLIGNKIILTCASAQATKYVNISTPLSFVLRYVRSRHDDGTNSELTISNTTDTVISAITVAASDTDLDVAADVDDDYATFYKGEDDLRVDVATDVFTGIVEFEIEPIVE